MTCSCDSAVPVPRRATRPVAIASCVAGELSASAESAFAASSLTSGIPDESAVTSGEIAPALTMTTGEPGLCAARSLRQHAARRCAPGLALPSRATRCLASSAWLSGLSRARRDSASATCLCAMTGKLARSAEPSGAGLVKAVVSSRRLTSGAMPLARAIACWIEMSSVRCHSAPAAFSLACVVPAVMSATSGTTAPASEIARRRSSLLSSSSPADAAPSGGTSAASAVTAVGAPASTEPSSSPARARLAAATLAASAADGARTDTSRLFTDASKSMSTRLLRRLRLKVGDEPR